MKKRVIEKRTEFLAFFELVFKGLPYRISYFTESYAQNENTKEIVKIGAKLLWTNQLDTYVVRLTDTVAYTTDLPNKKTFILFNKQSKASIEMWKNTEGEI